MSNDLSINGSTLIIPATDKHLVSVREKYAETHKIEAVLGTKVDMRCLAENESICWGDGETYHFKLTKNAH